MINIVEKLVVQNYGSSLALYIYGKDDAEAYSFWLSLFNLGATGQLGSQPEYVAAGVIQCWTTTKKLKEYLFNRHVLSLPWNKGQKGGCSAEAHKLAKLEWDSLKWETYRSVNSGKADDCEIEAENPYEILEKEASQEDLNHKDLCTFAAYVPKEA